MRARPAFTVAEQESVAVGELAQPRRRSFFLGSEDHEIRVADVVFADAGVVLDPYDIGADLTQRFVFLDRFAIVSRADDDALASDQVEADGKERGRQYLRADLRGNHCQ
jgi:hypothetical protein